jgi:NADH-quinone oxidoreductase subunit M
MACLACTGLIAATLYSLRIMQKVFFGKENTKWEMKDLSIREKMVSLSLVLIIFGLGLYPKPVFEIAGPALQKTLQNHTDKTIQLNEAQKSKTDLNSKLYFFK